MRWSADVGVPEAGREEAQNRYWRSLVAKALITASGALARDPGPVHLNLALREPLMPDDERRRAWPAPGPAVRTARPGRPARARRPRDAPADGPAAATLVVAGDGRLRSAPRGANAGRLAGR